MITIQKEFPNYPFAHRQPSHKGHCKLIHGHNWDFEICLAANELDENGFVYDFGGLKWFRAWLENNFDHTFVLNEDDPWVGTATMDLIKETSKVIFVPSCSCEGIAEYVYNKLSDMISKQTEGRVWVEWVTVKEDLKNSATCTASTDFHITAERVVVGSQK